MKILILTFYYQPDLCAGSFRATALVEELKQHFTEIEVITTLPNRYSSFQSKALEYEEIGNVKIHRIEIGNHKSGMIDQAQVFFKFYQQAFRIVKNKKYDLVFATSSRLFTAFLGARISPRTNSMLYLDIRDIFLDTLKDVLNKKISFFILPFIKLVENYAFSRANHINLVSGGFKEYFHQKYPSKSFSFYTNGIDPEFLTFKCTDNIDLKGRKIILYAGNIGEGQGLHNIIPKLASALSSEYIFRIIGDGGRRNNLQSLTKDMENVQLIAPVNRAELIIEYQKADILFLHLNDYEAFYKVLPSKIFEYASTGKPILAGVAGFSASFLASEVKSNVAIFKPGNADEAILSLKTLSMGCSDRSNFIYNYARSSIMKEMANNIISVI